MGPLRDGPVASTAGATHEADRRTCLPSIRSMIDPGGRLLARHLNRLSETLETFRERLREVVSSAIGDTVAGVVRETVRTILAEEPTVSTSSGRQVSCLLRVTC